MREETTTETSTETSLSRAEADELAVAHVRLVAHIVRETMSRVPAHVDRDDLNSAGLTALVTASRSFDPSRGLPFARYAATRIRGAILDELRGIDWASRAVRRRSREVEEARARLAAAIGQFPDNAQVAADLGISVADIESNQDDIARANVLSLQGSTETSFDDILASSAPSPEQQVVHQERLEYLVEAVDELPERLRAVVSGYFLDERPMAEIAAELGVTESRVSQMRAEALVLLKDALNSALEPDLVAAHPKPEGCAARRRDAYFRAVAERHTRSRRTTAPVRAVLDTSA